MQGLVIIALKQHVTGMLAQAFQAVIHGVIHVAARRVPPGAVGQGQLEQDIGRIGAARLLLNRPARLFQAPDRVAEVTLAVTPEVPGQ